MPAIIQRVAAKFPSGTCVCRFFFRRTHSASSVKRNLALSTASLHFPHVSRNPIKNQPGCSSAEFVLGHPKRERERKSSSGRIETQLQLLWCGIPPTRRPSSLRGGSQLDRSETTPSALHTASVIRDESGTPRVPAINDRTAHVTLSAEASRRSLRRLRRVPALIASCCARTAPPVPPNHPSTFLVRRHPHPRFPHRRLAQPPTLRPTLRDNASARSRDRPMHSSGMLRRF